MGAAPFYNNSPRFLIHYGNTGLTDGSLTLLLTPSNSETNREIISIEHVSKFNSL